MHSRPNADSARVGLRVSWRLPIFSAIIAGLMAAEAALLPVTLTAGAAEAQRRKQFVNSKVFACAKTSLHTWDSGHPVLHFLLLAASLH